VVSVIVPWADRPELKDALLENRVWLESAPVTEVVVVCCGGDPESLPTLLGPELSFVRIVRARSHAFNKALALNLGVGSSRGEQLLFLDCDVLLPRSWARRASELVGPSDFVTLRAVHESAEDAKVWQECFASPQGSRPAPGIVMLMRQDFLAVEGMNSELSGWGWEDLDLVNRLEFQGARRQALGWGVHLSHADRSRRFWGDKLDNQERNAALCLSRYQAGDINGTFSEDLRAQTWLEAFQPVGADLSLLDWLARNHALQWALEDQSRQTEASDQDRARIKAEIDACNSARHKAIAGFDASMSYPAPDPQARKVSETPGELADRLLILELKIDCAQRAEDRRQLRAWRDHLIACLNEVLEGMAAGTVLLPPRTPLKVYATVEPERPVPGGPSLSS
jgi:hypothetical protein